MDRPNSSAPRLRYAPHVLDKALDLSPGSDERFERQIVNEEAGVQAALREARADAKRAHRELAIPLGYQPLAAIVPLAGGRGAEMVRQLARAGKLGEVRQIGGPTAPILINVADALDYFRAHEYKRTKPRKPR
jgi:hypothetical protein